MSIYTPGTDPHEPLEAVLRAATTPGHPEELVGEHAAVAAFRTAGEARHTKRRFLARVLTVKALVVGGVAVSTGVVLAAVGGVVPVPWQAPTNTPPANEQRYDPASVPSDTLENSPAPTSEKPAGGPGTPPSTVEPRGGRDDERDEPDGDRSGPNHDRDGQRDDDQRDDDQQDEYQPPMMNGSTTPSSSREKTPDSPAPGAVSAVPPNGAYPPSPGD